MKSSIRSTWTFGLTALGLAVLFDQLFWKKPAGISFLVWISIVLAAGFILAAIEKVRPARRSYLLVCPIFIFALMTFIRHEELTRSFSAMAALGLLLLLAATFRTGNWISYRSVDYLTSFFKWLGAALTQPVELTRSQNGADSKSSPANGTNPVRKTVVPVLRGLALAFPIVLILTILLSSADPIFNDQINNFFALFRVENLGEFLFRLVYIMVFGYLFAGTLLHAIHPRKEEPRPDPNDPQIVPFIGFTESLVVLLCVDLLFLLFVSIQFRYLFGGQANITSTGYTYSEYARRGFFELVTVAVISLLLYLAFAAATKIDTSNRKKAFTVLSVFLVAEVLTILASAWMRLSLYESAYGFTRLRTYTHIFIPWLAVLLVFTILLEALHRRGRFALFLLICSTGFVFSLGMINVDGLIVRQNIRQTMEGQELDFQYLNSLSTDAVPAIVSKFNDPSLPEKLHDLLGASLSCRTADEKDTAGTDDDWTAFHYADLTARKLIDQQSEKLTAYPIQPEGNGIIRVKVGGTTLPCLDFDYID